MPVDRVGAAADAASDLALRQPGDEQRQHFPLRGAQRLEQALALAMPSGDALLVSMGGAESELARASALGGCGLPRLAAGSQVDYHGALDWLAAHQRESSQPIAEIIAAHRALMLLVIRGPLGMGDDERVASKFLKHADIGVRLGIERSPDAIVNILCIGHLDRGRDRDLSDAPATSHFTCMRTMEDRNGGGLDRHDRPRCGSDRLKPSPDRWRGRNHDLTNRRAHG